MGYNTARMTIGELKKNQYTVKLSPGVFELETLNISNVKPHADSIMAAVKKNLSNNYKTLAQSLKNEIFYREAVSFKPAKLEVAIDKSTGFTKQNLKEANKQLRAFTTELVAQPPKEFTEMLCNYYSGLKTIDNKRMLYTKFEVVKAMKLKDKNKAVSINEMEKMASGILFQHLDSTKYYRIKSGIFGSRDTIPLGRGAHKDKQKTKPTRLSQAESDVTGFMIINNFLHTLNLDFVSKTELYNYSYEGAIIAENDRRVHVIKFNPRKSRAKYTGTLYISDIDYAIVKAEYDLAKGKKLGGVNLKFLLGVKQSENVSRGTIIFKERPTGSGYYLQYASEENGQYVYINRPLKFIEITKGEKDVAAFDLKVETNILHKREYFSMSQSEITIAEFDEVKEEEFDYLYLNSYDPKIWKSHSAIEPVEEMKRFKITE